MTADGLETPTGKTYLTSMNAKTKLSAKGQVVIPKDVRERMGLSIGDSFDVIARGNELVLRRESRIKKLSPAEAIARIRKIVRYDGPTIPIEQLGWHVRDGDKVR